LDIEGNIAHRSFVKDGVCGFMKKMEPLALRPDKRPEDSILLMNTT
jgi:hypothetical protein